MSIEETIIKRIEVAKDDQRAKFEEFNDCDDLYNSQIKTQPGASQVFNPRAWSAVEMLVPRIVAKNPTIEYIPREPSDQQRAEILSSLFQYWWDKVDGFTKLVEWVKSSTIYGTAIAKVCWETKERIVKKYALGQDGQPLLGKDGNYVIEEEKVTYFDDPAFRLVNPYKFYKNPGATSVEDAQWLAEEYTKPFSEIEKEQESTGIYKNLSKLKRVLTNKKEENTFDDHRHASAGNDTEKEDSTVDKINLIEMWDLLENKQYILAAGEVVILERENPYWHGRSPYIRLVDSIVPFEFYGKGEVYPIKGLQHSLNTVRNMRLDNLMQSINAMWKVKGDVDENELVWQPNGVIHTSDFDDAQIVEYPDVTGNAYQEESYITGEMDHALGTADFTQIGDSNSDRTASGMSIKAEQLNSRFYQKIQLMEKMGLETLGEIVLALYQQYITREKLIRVVGDNGIDWVAVSPQDIAGEFDCIAEAGSTQPVNKEKDKEEAVNLLSILNQDPDLKPEGRYELKTKMLEKFGYKKAPEMFYSPDEQAQMQQMNQEQQMAQEQANAQEQAMMEDIKHQRELEKMGAKGEMDMQREQLKMGMM